MGHEPGLAVERLLVRSRAHPPIRSVGLELARLDGVAKLDGEEAVAHLGVQRRICQREHDLDTMIQVARHQVRAAEIDLLLTAVAEVVDTAVLQKPPDDADHTDALADARNARPQTADTPD